MTDELTEAEREALIEAVQAGDEATWVERILADRLAVARAEALTEAADDFRTEGRDVMFNKAGDDLSPQGRVTKWLRDRAAAVARDGEGL